jgi:hypothetical protein
MKPRWLIRLVWALWGFVVANLAVIAVFAVTDRAETTAQGGGITFVAFTAFVLTFFDRGRAHRGTPPAQPDRLVAVGVRGRLRACGPDRGLRKLWAGD